MYYTFYITSFGMFGLYSHLYIKLEKWVFSSTFDQKTVNTFGEKSFASSINTFIILTNMNFENMFLPGIFTIFLKKVLP